MDHEIVPPEDPEKLAKLLASSSHVLALAVSGNWDAVLAHIEDIPCTCEGMIPVMVIWTNLGARTLQFTLTADDDMTFSTRDPNTLAVKGDLERWEEVGESFLNLIVADRDDEAVDVMHRYWHAETNVENLTSVVLGILEASASLARTAIDRAGGLPSLQNLADNHLAFKGFQF